MPHSTKWYATKTGITIDSGGTLTIASGGTLAATGYISTTPASVTTTGTLVVGSTLHVTTTSALDGAVNIGVGNFTVDASGNTVCKGTLGVTGAFSVNTSYFTSDASGNIVAKGTANLKGAVTIGAATTAKSIIIDPSGTSGKPGTASMVQIVFDGTDLVAQNQTGAKANMTTGLWAGP